MLGLRRRCLGGKGFEFGIFGGGGGGDGCWRL